MNPLALEPTTLVASFENIGAFLNEPVEHIDLGSHPLRAPMTTARKMRDRIRESAANSYVRKWAERIVQNVPPRDQQGEVDAIFRFTQSRLRFARDPLGTEFVQSPVTILRQIEVGDLPSGDCDDHVVLGLSLAKSLGYPTVIRVTGYPHNTAGRYSHVYGMVNVKGEWIPFDAVRTDRNLGWQAPNVVRRFDLRVD